MSPAAGFTREGRPERDGDGGGHEPGSHEPGSHEPGSHEPGGPTVPENGGRNGGRGP